MKVAIFSDVHGNYTALEAVLKDIKKHEPDHLIFAGDLCTDGARPSACVKKLRSEALSPIYGNTDERVNNGPVLSRNRAGVARRRTIEAKAENDNDKWTWAQLDPADRTWLSAHSFYRRVSPTQHPKDDLFVVHANPLDTEHHIFPSEERQKELFGEVRQPDDDVTLKKLLGHINGGIVAFGHLHIPFIRQWNDITLVNVSSVSLPLDGDQRAKYALFTWDAEQGSWTIEHQYVAYDVDKEIEALRQIRPPNWENLITKLRVDSPVIATS